METSAVTDMPRAERVRRLERALLALDRDAVRRVIAEGPVASEYAEQLIVPAFEAIGDAWERGVVALAQVYMASKLCEEVVSTALPAPRPGRSADRPTVAIASLEDHHVFGPRLLASVLGAAGVPFVDYGYMGVERLVLEIEEDGIEDLLVSTLMLRAALRVKPLVEGLRARGLTTRVIVGGAPFRLDENLFREVGADAMGRAASDALRLIGARS